MEHNSVRVGHQDKTHRAFGDTSRIVRVGHQEKTHRASGDTSRIVRVVVIAGDGINCEEETAYAFEQAGARADTATVNQLVAGDIGFAGVGIIAIPGGFSFADYLGSGTVLALKFRRSILQDLTDFHARGGLIIGICNGFQVLVKLGAFNGFGNSAVALAWNESGVFQNYWVGLAANSQSPCVFTKGITAIDLPIRHGEGRMRVLDHHGFADAQIALTYTSNPNGSERDIAGICDSTGRIFGLMPHPEAFIAPEFHPDFSLGRAPAVTGLNLLRNGVEYARSA